MKKFLSRFFFAMCGANVGLTLAYLGIWAYGDFGDYWSRVEYLDRVMFHIIVTIVTGAFGAMSHDAST